MKIWLGPSAFHPLRGGVEELTLQLARELNGRGHDVLVVVNRHPFELPPREDVEGIPVARIAFSAPRRSARSMAQFPPAFVAQLRQLRRLSPRPDVIHVQCPSVQLAPLTAIATLSQTPMVITTQGETVMDADALFQRSAFLRAALRSGAHRASALTACSAWSADQASRFAGLFGAAEVIPNGVDPRQWRVTPLPDSPVFCAWGRLVPQKGFDLLLAAFGLAREALPGARLLLAGDGVELHRLTAMAGPGVELVGALDRPGVQRLLSRSRVVVVPSRIEPFGIVAVEAMAAGRTVVWSTIGGLRDATGGLGYPVDPFNPRALAAAMVSAVRTPLEPSVVRAHAETLSWSRLTDRYVAVYDRVLSRRHTRQGRHGGRHDGSS